MAGIVFVNLQKHWVDLCYNEENNFLKIKSWHLIVSAIIVFFLDFFTLGNRHVIDNQITNKIAFVIGLLCVLVFLFGIIKTLHDFFQKNKEPVCKIGGHKIHPGNEKEQRLASVTETIIRRLFGFILLITTIPFFLNIITLPTIIIFLTFAIYCLKSRRYRLVWEIFWVVLALLIYFVSIPPIGWGVYPALKATRLSLDTGGIYLFGGAPLIFCTLALFLLGSDLTSRFKKISQTAWHNILPIILFLLAAAYFGLSPFISKIVVEPGYGSFTRGGSGGGIEKSPSPELIFDQQQNLWTYNFQMENNLQDEAEIEKIFGDKSEIPLSIGENIKIEGAVFANGKILIKPGQKAVITILSPKPLGIITFQGKNTSVAYDFWK